jgi:argininosuccinate lyase
MQPNRERMHAAADAGYATATDLADWLVRSAGLPFRDAHHVTGRIVAEAAKRKLALEDMPLDVLAAIHPAINADIYDVLSVDASVASRTSEGGTAPKNVRRAARVWLKRLADEGKAAARRKRDA